MKAGAGEAPSISALALGQTFTASRGVEELDDRAPRLRVGDGASSTVRAHMTTRHYDWRPSSAATTAAGTSWTVELGASSGSGVRRRRGCCRFSEADANVDCE